ncbi:hypothetical protein CE143_04465 [Photorhabdus luminescens]|uniref:Transposase n=1 Tax=Photorhabdus akhurstii TaxID=171438 RepID=A0ABX8LPJ6_9GAMM|nr:hypothetical protein [Photorhabdus akhurstii]QXF32504.1 hypothetical protein B0X70_04535 [Photorhabdus akhurstii]UJD74298.1 hypothetical protein CE143_04465 [Photorhabdus luminescens]
MIKEMGVNLNTVSRSATLTGFKPKKSNIEKGENRKPKYQFNENKNVKYGSVNVKTFRHGRFTIKNKHPLRMKTAV